MAFLTIMTKIYQLVVMASQQNHVCGFVKVLYDGSLGTKVAYRAKTQFFAPERYTAGVLYTDSLNSF